MEDLSAILDRLNRSIESVKKLPDEPGAVLNELVKLRAWIIGDRSMIEHRMVQAIITYLYQSYGDKYDNREDFKDDLLLNLDYCKKTVYMHTSKDKCPHCNGDVELKLKTIKYKPHSLSFGQCTQAKHHEITMKLIDMLPTLYPDFSFTAWKQEWENNANTLQ